jgi:hypothetical protein
MACHYSVSASHLESELHSNDLQPLPRHEVYQSNETKAHKSTKLYSVLTTQRGRCSSEPMTSGCHSYRIARKNRMMVVRSGIEISDVSQSSFVPSSTSIATPYLSRPTGLYESVISPFSLCFWHWNCSKAHGCIVCYHDRRLLCTLALFYTQISHPS